MEQAAEDLGVRRLREACAARGGDLPTNAEVSQLFGGSPVDRMLAATFEMAVADAELRATGRSLADDLGITEGFETQAVGAVVGIPDAHDVTALRREVKAVVQAGAARVRLKVEPGWVLDPVRAVRADHPDLVVQVDANGSFTASRRGRGGAEPVGRLRRAVHRAAAATGRPGGPRPVGEAGCPVPICLDESLSTPRRVRDALRNGACAMACLKPARLGGVRATRAAHAECAAAGVPTFVGGFFEAGLGRSSNLALAARLSQDATGLVSDVGDPADYLALDPCGYPPVAGGWVRVPTAPGVGGPPDGTRAGAARGAASLVPRHLHLTLHASRPLRAADQRCPHPVGPGAGGVGRAE